jgi:hypothetical protein
VVCCGFSTKDASVLCTVFFSYIIVCCIARYCTESTSKDVPAYTSYITVLKALKALYNLTVVFEQLTVIELIVLNKSIVD